MPAPALSNSVVKHLTGSFDLMVQRCIAEHGISPTAVAEPQPASPEPAATPASNAATPAATPASKRSSANATPVSTGTLGSADPLLLDSCTVEVGAAALHYCLTRCLSFCFFPCLSSWLPCALVDTSNVPVAVVSPIASQSVSEQTFELSSDVATGEQHKW